MLYLLFFDYLNRLYDITQTAFVNIFPSFILFLLKAGGIHLPEMTGV